MTSSSRAPLAGGFVLAVSILVGSIVGATQGQPSIGFLVGAGFGIAVSLAIWALDRRR